MANFVPFNRDQSFLLPPDLMTWAAARQDPCKVAQPWRIAMQARLETEDAKALYKRRKETVEPVFGIIKSAIGFTRFRLRDIKKVASEWMLTALAYNCRRINRLKAA